MDEKSQANLGEDLAGPIQAMAQTLSHMADTGSRHTGI